MVTGRNASQIFLVSSLRHHRYAMQCSRSWRAYQSHSSLLLQVLGGIRYSNRIVLLSGRAGNEQSRFHLQLFSLLCKQLKFPLSTGNFLVDSFEVKTSLNTKVGVLFNEISSVGVSSTDRAVVQSLWSGISTHRESLRGSCVSRIHDKVLLLETEPEVIIIVVNGSTRVRYMCRSICIQYFRHH